MINKVDLIRNLTKKLGISTLPSDEIKVIKDLGSFWPHLYLAKIKCALSNEDMISVYNEECPYPVWRREKWLENANPPSFTPILSQKIFPQMFDLFKMSPIPHKIGYGNENCEYTDDWFYSKDCFQCHSGAECRDLYYSYAISKSTDCISCVMSRNLTLCFDVINSNFCYECFYCVNSNNLKNCGFCFDCHNCENCLFSTNQKNKQYLLFNKQVSEKEFKDFKAKLLIQNPREYLKYIDKFRQFVQKEAYLKDLFLIHSENSTGNYLYEVNNCIDCFFLKGNQDCYFCVRSFDGKDADCMYCVSNFDSQLCYMCSMAQVNCYDVKYSSNLIKCKHCEYCFNCERCENCFGCSGLVDKKYFIFNKEYSPEEYVKFKAKIIEAMNKFNEYGNFFPEYFAPVKFENSWSSLYFDKQQEHRDITIAEDIVPGKIYKDCISGLPFMAKSDDVSICNKLNAPLPYTHYVTRIRDHMRWVPYDGSLRDAVCSDTKKNIRTSWTGEFDSRLLSTEAYYDRFLK